MLRESENIVRIEGLLSEVALNYGVYTSAAGQLVDYIGGIIKIQVTQEVDNEKMVLEIPVHMFAPKLTNKGKENPAYKSIEKIMTEYTSIAAAGGVEGADRIRITNGSLVMNEYYGRDGRLISFPRVSGSFVNKVKPEVFKPEAVFSITFVVAKKMNEIDEQGIETGRYKVTGIVPQYGGKVDVFNFMTSNPKVINAISQYWNENDTVSAVGRLNFTSEIKTITKEVDFGEAPEVNYTTSTSELILTGGSATPLDGEFAYEIAEIEKALVERKNSLEASKIKAEKNDGTTKAPMKSTKGPIDLGF